MSELLAVLKVYGEHAKAAVAGRVIARFNARFNPFKQNGAIVISQPFVLEDGV